MKVAGRSPNASRVTSDYIIDDGTFPLEEPLCDSDEKSAENKSFSGKDPHGSQIVVLRIAGTICVLFGLIEIGIGSYLFKEFSNAQAGAWWSVLLPTVAGIFFTIAPFTTDNIDDFDNDNMTFTYFSVKIFYSMVISHLHRCNSRPTYFASTFSQFAIDYSGALALISTTRLRVSIILLFAAVGALVAIIGAATDGATSSQVRSAKLCIAWCSMTTKAIMS